MTSKEALIKICNHITKADNEGYTETIGLEYADEFGIIKNDLEVLENVKNKTNLFFSQRKQIAKEFNCWCVENNADALDSTNLVTWLLCFKLKEWLENDK